MTIRKANAAAQKPDRWGCVSAAGSTRTLPVGCGDRCVLTWRSPDLHAAVDDQVDARDVCALVAGEKQRDVRHVLGLAESAHRGPGRISLPKALFSRPRPGGFVFDEAGEIRVAANPVLASLHRKL